MADDWTKEQDKQGLKDNTKEKWDAYKIFYDIRFQKLDDNRVLQPKKGRANSAMETTETEMSEADIQDDVETLQANYMDIQESVAANSRALATVMEDLQTEKRSSYDRPPTPIAHTSNQTSVSDLTTKDLWHMMEKRLNMIEQQMHNNQSVAGTMSTTIPSTIHPKPQSLGRFRQMNRYCHTHGINCTHDGNECINRRRNHKVEATFHNRLGGSDRLENKWLQWWDNKEKKFVPNKPDK